MDEIRIPPVSPPRWWLTDRGLDVVLPGAAAVFTAGGIVAAEAGADPGEHGVGILGWMIVPSLAGVLLLRRRFPVGVLVVSIGLTLVYYTTGRPAIGLELPLAAAFFNAAERGRTGWAATLGVILSVFAYSYRIIDGQNVGSLLGVQLPTTLLVIGGAIAAGEAVRSRKRRQELERQRDELLVQRRDDEARRVIEAERAGLARDVHDVLAHTVTVIAIHADVAHETVRDDPDSADNAIREIRSAASSAMRDLRSSLEVLRGGGGRERDPVEGLDAIDTLAEKMAGLGLQVDVRWLGEPVAVPSAVEGAAFRIVREALTNTVRHTHAERAEVIIGYQLNELGIIVTDSGRVGPNFIPGNGIRGMRETAALVGGSVDARPGPGESMTIRASLPWGSL